MVYTDGTHLIADSLDELHCFAASIGLKRKWFQGRHRIPHYDFTTSRKSHTALSLGISRLTTRELIAQYRAKEGVQRGGVEGHTGLDKSASDH